MQCVSLWYLHDTSCVAVLLTPELAQAVLVGAATHASGSGGRLQADPPLVTSWTALTHNTGLPAGRASGPLPFSFSLSFCSSMTSWCWRLFDARLLGLSLLATGLRPRLFHS